MNPISLATTLILGSMAVGASFGLVAGAVPHLHPIADSFAHFRLHFAAILALAALLFALDRRGQARRGGLAVAGAMVLLIAGYAYPDPPAGVAATDLRIAQFNLNFGNGEPDLFLDGLRGIDADIVTLQEATDAHWRSLAALDDLYPHRRRCPFTGRTGGVAILSKTAFLPGRGDCVAGSGMIREAVRIGGEPVTVISLHAFWPWPHRQHDQIDALAPRLDGLDGPLVVAGDFNAAPWSHAVARMEESSRTRVVPGLRATIDLALFRWLPSIPIPIDHVLLSPDLCPAAARAGSNLGSDHRVVIVDIDRAGSGECD